MRIYRDPETGRFITKTRWEEIQREKEREKEMDDFDDFEDFDDFGEDESFSPQGDE